MELIEREGLTEAMASFQREALHLEARDAYGTQVEIPHLARWAAGEPDDLEWLTPWCDNVRAGVAEGKRFRRARIVSEPLSEYQQWSYSIADPMVEAGEDIRWVPRRLVSGIAFPGNDFWLFDQSVAIFTIFAGNGLIVERQRWTDPSVIRLCKAAFEAAWRLSIPHHEYKPV